MAPRGVPLGPGGRDAGGGLVRGEAGGVLGPQVGLALGGGRVHQRRLAGALEGGDAEQLAQDRVTVARLG